MSKKYQMLEKKVRKQNVWNLPHLPREVWKHS